MFLHIGVIGCLSGIGRRGIRGNFDELFLKVYFGCWFSEELSLQLKILIKLFKSIFFSWSVNLVDLFILKKATKNITFSQ